MAEEGLVLLNKMVDTIDFPTLLKEMAIQEDYLEDVYNRYPHVPLFTKLITLFQINMIFRYNQLSFQLFAHRGGQHKRLCLC